MGKTRAAVLVSGITQDRTALLETQPPKGSDTSLGISNETPLGLLGSPPPVLSKFEVTGGTDRLFFTPDAFRQASLFGEARYSLSETVQLGATGAIRMQSNGYGIGTATEVSLQLLIGPTFNFGSDSLRNAFFFSPKIGATVSRTTLNGIGTALNTSTMRTVSLVFGKRFSIGRNLAFAPSIGVLQVGTQAPYLSVTPLAFSFFF